MVEREEALAALAAALEAVREVALPSPFLDDAEDDFEVGVLGITGDLVKVRAAGTRIVFARFGYRGRCAAVLPRAALHR
jgi:hypothetical protein